MPAAVTIPAAWSDSLAPRPPLVALTFAAGIATASVLGPWFIVTAAALAALLANRRGLLRKRLAVLCAVLALGAVGQTLRGAETKLDDEPMAEAIAGHAARRELRGVVVRPVVPRAADRHELLVELRGGEGRERGSDGDGDDDEQRGEDGARGSIEGGIEGRVVRVMSPRSAAAGDVIRFEGRLRPPRGARNPGSPDRAASARRDGIELEVSVQAIEIVGRDEGIWLDVWRALGALRDRWAKRVTDPDPVADPDSDSVTDPDSDPVTDPDSDPVTDPDPDPDPDPVTASVPAPSRFDVARAVLLGVTLGLRADIPPSLDERWRAVGIYHVLSVSGLHLAVVALLLFTALRRLAAALAVRTDPAVFALLPALAAATAYTMLTGAQIATLRALLVAALWMIARAAGRPLRLLDAIAAAALVLLAWAPSQLWQPSFQLSFAAAIALACHPRAPTKIAPRIAPRLTFRFRPFALAATLSSVATALLTAARAVTSFLARGATTAAWVTLVTSPITAYHFQQVQPGGVLGNLFLTPLVELAALPVGLAGLVLGELSTTLGAALITAAAAVLAFADALAAILQPWCPVGAVAIASPLTAVAIWAATTALCARKHRGPVDAAAWCALCALWLTAPLAAPDGARVVFLDVGQGDAALVETAAETWLVDAGGAPGAPTALAAAAPGRAIPRYLALSRRSHIDVAVISHPHPDHYLGLLALDGLVTIGELWLPPGFVDAPVPARAPSSDHDARALVAPAPSFAEIVERLRRAGTVIRPPPDEGRTSRDGAHLTVIAPRYREHPDEPARLAADPIRSINDNSAVVLLEYAGRRVLFAADLELEGEDALVELAARSADSSSSALVSLGPLGPLDLRADVVKVPHHGSRTSSTQRFVDAVAASYAVISCGVANRFGFPAPEVVERWRERGATVLRTDRGGAVLVEIAPTGALEVRRPR